MSDGMLVMLETLGDVSMESNFVAEERLAVSSLALNPGGGHSAKITKKIVIRNKKIPSKDG